MRIDFYNDKNKSIVGYQNCVWMKTIEVVNWLNGYWGSQNYLEQSFEGGLCQVWYKVQVQIEILYCSKANKFCLKFLESYSHTLTDRFSGCFYLRLFLFSKNFRAQLFIFVIFRGETGACATRILSTRVWHDLPVCSYDSVSKLLLCN